MILTSVLLLLAAFQVKHFLADYPLQTSYMLGKFAPGREFVKPLAAHAGVHALLTFSIARLFLCAHPWGGLTALGLAALDFATHFTMDRVKASPRLLGRFKALSAGEFAMLRNYPGPDGEKRRRGNTLFWWSLGFDQMVHHLTHYAIIWYLVTR